MLRKSVKTKGSVLNHRKIAVAPNFWLSFKLIKIINIACMTGAKMRIIQVLFFYCGVSVVVSFLSQEILIFLLFQLH